MQRTAIGILTLVVVAVGLAWPFVQPESDDTLPLACWRVAMVLGALWLAFPQVSRLPPWQVASVTAALAVIAARPKLVLIVLRPKVLLVAIPLLIALWFLRPRKKRTK